MMSDLDMSVLVVRSLLVIFSILSLSWASENGTEFDDYQVFMPQIRVSLNQSSQSRIISGYEAYPNDYPYQVGMEIAVTGGWTWCGGSIIAPNFVVTAAHCVDKALYVNIIFGAHDRNDALEPGRLKMYVPKVNFIVHPYWNSAALLNDIALIRLPVNLTYSKKIQQVALPTRACATNMFHGSPAITSGWGYLRGTVGLSRYLQYADVIIMDLTRCKSFLRQVTNSNICIDGSYGLGVCYGDSGSALVTTSGFRMLLGITSFVAASGCEINFPSVFTRVASYLDWISANSGIEIG